MPWRPYYAPRAPARYILETEPELLDQVSIGDEVDFEDYPAAAAPSAGVLLLACIVLWPWPRRQPARAARPRQRAEIRGAPGDTLYDIARNFGVTVDTLPAPIRVWTLPPSRWASSLIPGFEGVTGTLATHSLEPGETLDSLALRLGLRRDTLVRLNGIVNPELFFINESAVIVEAADAAPAVPTGATYLLAPGEGLLEFAAAHNQSPWGLAASNRLSDTAGAVGGRAWLPRRRPRPPRPALPAARLTASPVPGDSGPHGVHPGGHRHAGHADRAAGRFGVELRGDAPAAPASMRCRASTAWPTPTCTPDAHRRRRRGRAFRCRSGCRCTPANT